MEGILCHGALELTKYIVMVHTVLFSADVHVG